MRETCAFIGYAIAQAKASSSSTGSQVSTNLATTTPSIIHGLPPVNATNVPAHNRTIRAMRHCAHYARVCQTPYSHKCETLIFFSHNMPKTPVTSRTSTRHPTLKLLTRVPDICPSIDDETIESSPSQLESRTSVLQLTLKLLTRVPVVCPSTDAETIESHPSRMSSGRRNH